MAKLTEEEEDFLFLIGEDPGMGEKATGWLVTAFFIALGLIALLAYLLLPRG